MTDSKRRILVVDDDPDFLDATRLILEAGGYEVETAGDGREGTDAAYAMKPDLILVDVMMEDVDSGFVFAERLGKEFRVILVSSIADSSVKVFDAHKLPVRGILQKPVKPDVLLERVRIALEIPFVVRDGGDEQ